MIKWEMHDYRRSKFIIMKRYGPTLYSFQKLERKVMGLRMRRMNDRLVGIRDIATDTTSKICTVSILFALFYTIQYHMAPLHQFLRWLLVFC